MKKRNVFLLILLLILPTLIPFFNTRFFYTQDYIFIARLQQIVTAFFSGYFPVRWAPDLRFGEPIFNFYASLPFYLGALIKLTGFNVIWTAKILFILSSVLSAVSMYIFCKKVFSAKAAMLATVLYAYAPYRAVDMYIRGAIAEAWAFVFFPLIFYTSLLLEEKVNFKRIVFLALSLAGLALTHNVTTLMFLPFLGLFWIYLVLKQKRWQLVFPLLASSILSVGLAAFFLLPALMERQFIQTQYLIAGYFNFRIHFVAIKQFFSTFWGYGSSGWGPNDGMSFQVGVIHWMIVLTALFVGFIFRRDKKLIFLLSFLGVSLLLSLFLQHTKSDFIWEAIPLMSFIQFPWRFLAISIFIVSIMGAVIAEKFKGRFAPLTIILIILVIAVNVQYFRPKDYLDDNFFDKFLNMEIMHTGRDLTKDYLPIWVKNVDIPYFDKPRAEAGEITVLDFKRGVNSAQASIEVKSQSLIEIPITYFPGWEVWANNKLVPKLLPSEKGLIRFQLSKGIYKINIEFKDTLIRTIGNITSLVSLFLVLAFLVVRRFRFK